MDRHPDLAERLAAAVATSRAVRAELARDLEHTRQQLRRGHQDIEALSAILLDRARDHARSKPRPPES